MCAAERVLEVCDSMCSGPLMPAWLMLQDLRTCSMGFSKARVSLVHISFVVQTFLDLSSVFSTASLLEISDTAYCHLEES